MESTIVISLVLNALMGIAMFFMKQSHDQTKDDINRIRIDVDKVRESSFKKEDFKEFKEELWRRLDKYEASVERRIAEK